MVYSTNDMADIIDKIEFYRNKLLDLSMRNSLINFHRNDNRKNQMTIVNTNVNYLYSQLVVQRKTFTISPIPDRPDEPKDEQTKEFLNAFERAKLDDEEYTNAISSDYVDDQEISIIERRIKDKVRQQLNYPPREECEYSDKEWAKINNIDITDDIPDNIESDKLEIWVKKYKNDLRKKVVDLNKLIKQDEDNRGVNTLYLAIGFLQYYDSPSSSKANLAPLILVKLQKIDGEEKYRISYTGDEIRKNDALEKKLQQFNIVLPSFNSNETVEDYFKKINEAVSGHKGWKVRRYVTIGRFVFSRLVMYSDLDLKKNWKNIREIINSNKNLARFFCGSKEATGNASFDYDIDRNKEVRERANILISSADSSQHSAIIEAMKGESLVIKGPPGTGKSQTIVNLIANALNKGKKVLFVSEKKAALDVVYDRLKKANLEDFCLELHSDKTNFANFKKAFEVPIRNISKTVSDIPLDEFNRKVNELQNKKIALRDYYDFLNSFIGKEKSTIVDTIWNSKDYEAQIGVLAIDLESIKIERADEMDAVKFVSILDKLNDLISVDKILRESDDNPKKDNFSFMSLKSADIFQLFNQFAQKQYTVADFSKNIIRKYKSYEFKEEPNLNHIHKLADTITEIQNYVTTKQFNAEILQYLKAKEVQTALYSTLQEIEKYIEVEKTIKDNICCKPIELENSISTFMEKYNQIKNIPLDISTCLRDEVIDLLQQLQKEYSFFEKNQDIVREAGQIIFGQTLLSLQHILQTILILKEYTKISPKAFAYWSNKNIVSSSNLQILTDVRNDISSINALKQELHPHFDLSLVEEKSSAIQKAYDYWDNKTIFAFANIKYWQAKQLFEKIQKRKNPLLNIDRFVRKLSVYVTQITKFKSNQQYREILGNFMRGTDTPIDEIIKANEFYNKIQQLALRCVRYNIELNPSDWDINKMQFLYELSQKVEKIDDCSDFTTLEKICSNCGTYETSLKCMEKTVNTLSEFNDCCLNKLRDNIFINKIKDIIEVANECVKLKSKISKGIKLLKKYIPTLALRNGREIVETRNTLDLARKISATAFSAKINDSLFANSIKAEIKKLNADFSEMSKQANEIKNIISFVQQNVEIKFSKYSETKSIGLLPIKYLSEAIKDLLGLKDYVYALCSYKSRLNNAIQTECKNLIDYFVEKKLPFDNVVECFKFTFYTSLLKCNDYKAWKEFAPERLNNLEQRVQEIDKEIYVLAQRALVSTVQKGINSQSALIRGCGAPKSEKSGLALLQQIINSKSRSIPIRQIMARAGKAIQTLKPCMLMSPISVAQYIPPESLSFDMLIIDEASQMYFEEALGSLLRSKQFVIVGDEKQLPPTNFFQKNNQTNEDDWDDNLDGDTSILEMCLQCNYNLQELLWHYRSKDQSLIAFSNLHFYNNDLNIPPSIITPENREEYESGVNYEYVNGLYKNSRNDIEAEEIAKEVQKFVRAHPDKSLGIATMNSTQQELIEQQIYILRDTDREVAKYLDEWKNKLESFFVKNLENVQGDERDYIFVSTVYGPETKNGKVAQRFGPINGRYGHRRLNVLFTRAKYGLKVFTSLKDSDIIISPASSEGLKIFQEYLTYAETGKLITAQTTESPVDSPFEKAVKRVLESKGYIVDTQVGVKGFFIDLAVRHPKHPALYTVGIECDGAAYHSSKSARDRDCIRQSILEASGWKIYRIWSQDWYYNTDKEIKKLYDYLEREMADEQIIQKKKKIDIKAIQEALKTETVQDKNTFATEVLDEDDLFYNITPQIERKPDEKVVDFGDLVEYEQNGKTYTVQVTQGGSDPERGLVNEYTQIGAAILGQRVDGEELHVNDFTIVIKKITPKDEIKRN